MDTRKLVLPALALVGGALIGRFINITTLMRGLMTTFALTGATRDPKLIEAPRARPKYKAAHKPARKAVMRKKSPPV